MDKIPDLKQALEEMKEYEAKYEISLNKLKDITSQIDTEKLKEHTLKREIEHYEKSNEYYEKVYEDISRKIEHYEIMKNKGSLLASTNSRTIKMFKNKISSLQTNINADVSDSSVSKNKANIEHLQLELKQLQEKIHNNNKIYQDMIKTCFNLNE